MLVLLAAAWHFRGSYQEPNSSRPSPDAARTLPDNPATSAESAPSDNATLRQAPHASPTYALTAQRIRTLPGGDRRVIGIQYDYPFLHTQSNSGVQVLDMTTGRLHMRNREGGGHVLTLPILDPYCEWHFAVTDPEQAGAIRIGDVEFHGRGGTVWELPARAPTYDGNMTENAMACHDLGGVRITVCNDVPLPVRVVYPDGVVEHLESIRLLPAGSLRPGIAP